MDRREFLLRLASVAFVPEMLTEGLDDQLWAFRHGHSAGAAPPRVRIVYRGSDDATHYQLLRYMQASGLSVRGYELIGNRPRIPKGFNGEWGHGLFLTAVRDSHFSDIHVSEVMGDGATITSLEPYGRVLGVTRGVQITNLHVAGARRNGISFIGAEGVKVSDFSIRDVRGAPRGPAAGVDFEPDPGTLGNRDLVLRDGAISDCHNFGIICDGTDTRNVLIERVTVRAAQTGWALWLTFPGGRNVVRGCTIYGPCVHLRNVHFERCRFVRDPANKQFGGHIASQYDNVSFSGCTFDG